MRKRPITFSRPLIPPVRRDEKTQTRRIAKQQPERIEDIDGREAIRRFGQRGDRLWVREDYRIVHQDGLYVQVEYMADNAILWKQLTSEDDAKLRRRKTPPSKVQPGRFMYRSCSRITLEVTGVRLERLQDISEEDARAEGVELSADPFTYGWKQYEETESAAEMVTYHSSARESFASLWRSINGADSWDANPWVWVVEFKRVTP